MLGVSNEEHRESYTLDGTNDQELNCEKRTDDDGHSSQETIMLVKLKLLKHALTW